LISVGRKGVDLDLADRIRKVQAVIETDKGEHDGFARSAGKECTPNASVEGSCMGREEAWICMLKLVRRVQILKWKSSARIDSESIGQLEGYHARKCIKLIEAKEYIQACKMLKVETMIDLS